MYSEEGFILGDCTHRTTSGVPEMLPPKDRRSFPVFCRLSRWRTCGLICNTWMQESGEAIYGTRPWYTYGEGPRKEVAETEEGQQKKFYELKYTAADVRYTVKGNNIYAVFRGQPTPNEPVVLKSFASTVVPGNLKINRVTMLGTDKEVAWQLQDNGLALRFSTQVPEKMAAVIRIETTDKL